MQRAYQSDALQVVAREHGVEVEALIEEGQSAGIAALPGEGRCRHWSIGQVSLAQRDPPALLAGVGVAESAVTDDQADSPAAVTGQVGDE